MIAVVGVDGSAQSSVALRRAVDLCGRLGAELHVVYVSHFPPVILAAVEHAPLQLDEMESATRDLVWSQVHQVMDAAPGAPPVTEVTLQGYPPDTLVKYAVEVGAGLIVVGSRGRGDLASLVLGSTSHRVLHEAPCDVLVVKGDGS